MRCVERQSIRVGDDHKVIIFLEFSGIKSTSIDEKSPMGVQPYIIPRHLVWEARTFSSREKSIDTLVTQILGRKIALDVTLLPVDTARIVCRLFRWVSHLANFLDTVISSQDVPYLSTAHAVARMQPSEIGN